MIIFFCWNVKQIIKLLGYSLFYLLSFLVYRWANTSCIMEGKTLRLFMDNIAFKWSFLDNWILHGLNCSCDLLCQRIIYKIILIFAVWLKFAWTSINIDKILILFKSSLLKLLDSLVPYFNLLAYFLNLFLVFQIDFHLVLILNSTQEER